MAGDLHIAEWVVVEETPQARREAARPERGMPIHRYGRVGIYADTARRARRPAAVEAPDLSALPGGLSEVERLGLAALGLRESTGYRSAKENRPRRGEEWDMPDCTTVVPRAEPTAEEAAAPGRAAAPAPTSSYLEGTVAVGIVIVEGPTPELQFSDAERTKVIAEVQNGLGFYAVTNPLAGISFAYDIQDVVLDLPADPNAPDLEAHWRNPAMAAIGFSADPAGVTAYVESLRGKFGTRWTYCAFFTKYPLGWFAYAWLGGPYLVMDYNNDGWGPDNIDRVFAHETGHIFNCPDEYASSGCNCGGSWGRFGLVNGNCQNCAAEGGVPCLMKGNSFELCGYTPGHLGWAPQLAVRDYAYGAGGWRVEKHPRFVVDTTGEGRADIVGFGDAGVYLSRSQPDGRFETPHVIVHDFGYAAGGWRVDRHPRFVVDVNGDGRADIVGFGDAGVYISYAQPDGTYGAPQFVVHNFGYVDDGWRVELHPRFVADITGDGRADIIGCGYAGVWVSRAQADGTYAPAQFVLADFGYTSGWRVERHPRFVVDVNGDGRADIVGFGDAGVYVSYGQANGTFSPPQFVLADFGYNSGWRVERHPRFVVDVNGDGRPDIVGFGDDGVRVSYGQADGTFSAPQLVVANFGYNAGGWRVERHPRFLADTTGDGRRDIVGFGDAGVWVSRSLAGGGFENPGRVIANFAYSAGGWRVEKHPRFLADITGEGRADVVGFGDAGVWVSRF
ncbi:Repeat domain-containing protein [Micromonospora rhizosphaerae]|uniref:Repeat domain-containing protein n=1 Tax=Micromonospora rhizosphaerae TaxID=568872 RepID=A0A1C6SIN1_9ACTN|nr:VCBS repeat-containing protein [Micromonospora rhizosphaerae]SCL29404.1 Repeat domain-containing protein [Micromonospora rhizosphaerae]